MTLPDDGVEVLARDGYVEVRKRGTYQDASFKKFVSQSIQACLERGLDLLLVDITEVKDFDPTDTQRYEIGILASKEGAALTRIAMLCTEEQLGSQFGSLVARNRGLNVQPFSRREEALAWLLTRAAP